MTKKVVGFIVGLKGAKVDVALVRCGGIVSDGNGIEVGGEQVLFQMLRALTSECISRD